MTHEFVFEISHVWFKSHWETTELILDTFRLVLALNCGLPRIIPRKTKQIRVSRRLIMQVTPILFIFMAQTKLEISALTILENWLLLLPLCTIHRCSLKLISLFLSQEVFIVELLLFCLVKTQKFAHLL